MHSHRQSKKYRILPDLHVYILFSTTITSLYKTTLQFLLPALNNKSLQVLTSLVLFSNWTIGERVHHYHFLVNWLTDNIVWIFKHKLWPGRRCTCLMLGGTLSCEVFGEEHLLCCVLLCLLLSSWKFLIDFFFHAVCFNSGVSPLTFFASTHKMILQRRSVIDSPACHLLLFECEHASSLPQDTIMPNHHLTTLILKCKCTL